MHQCNANFKKKKIREEKSANFSSSGNTRNNRDHGGFDTDRSMKGASVNTQRAPLERMGALKPIKPVGQLNIILLAR
jgi:hypothetical protein